jgi:hypothetical protein
VLVDMDMKKGRRESPPSRPGNASSGIRRRPGDFLRSDAGLLGRSGLIAWALLALGVAAGVMAIVAEFSTISKITVLTASCEDLAGPRKQDDCLQVGHERHGYALVLLGAFAMLMAWGATVGRSRPAAAALIVTGAVLLGIGLISDYPQGGKTGGFGADYAQARADRGTGLWLELGSGALMVGTGVGALLLSRRRPEAEPRRSREGAAEGSTA